MEHVYNSGDIHLHPRFHEKTQQIVYLHKVSRHEDARFRSACHPDLTENL